MPTRTYTYRCLLPLLLALLLMLGACRLVDGLPETSGEAETSAPTTTQEVITTEPIPPLDMSVHELGDGITWRLVDEDSPEAEEFWRRSQSHWNAVRLENSSEDEIAMPEGATVFARFFGTDRFKGETTSEIVLKKADGTETVLVESNANSNPWLLYKLNDRCFFYGRYLWGAGGRAAGYGVYDIQEMRDYPIQGIQEKYASSYASYVLLTLNDNYAYFRAYEHEEEPDLLRLYRLDLRDVEQGQELRIVDLLAGREDAKYIHDHDILPDASMFAVSTEKGLLLYDLRNDEIKLWQMEMIIEPEKKPRGFLAFHNEHTLYWCVSTSNDDGIPASIDRLAEIHLP